MFSVLIQMNGIKLNAQNLNSDFAKIKKDTLQKELAFYGGFVHQHQNFFGKAFSYQGVEAGAVFRQKFMAGLYGASFVSNLKINIENKTRFINLAQVGIFAGEIWKIQKTIHSGWMLNAGCFTLENDDIEFGIINPRKNANSLNGFVVSPQIFAEINLLKWMKLRIGLAYNFYFYNEDLWIKKSDLQNFSLNFGFIFGKFETANSNY